MKKGFLMECRAAMDAACDFDKDDSLSLFSQWRIWLHFMLCPSCAKELKNLRRVEEIMKTGFLPPSPDFEGRVMERLLCEGDFTREETAAPAGFSLRGWIITGFFLLLSLSSSFFGINFIEIANSEGLSFLLPVGITVGMAVTCYGALFIASHLKELSSRFGIR